MGANSVLSSSTILDNPVHINIHQSKEQNETTKSYQIDLGKFFP